jgi:hypothetical protein
MGDGEDGGGGDGEGGRGVEELEIAFVPSLIVTSCCVWH